MDCVFIDLGIARPMLGIEDDEHDFFLLRDMPFTRVYLSFILLHEFGHRQLRGGTRSPLDLRRRGGVEELEREADRFAIQRIVAA